METANSEFKGTPVIELPERYLIAGFLTDKFGREIDREALDRATKKYKGAKSLLQAVFNDSVIQGSNPFYVVLINEILRESNPELHTATQADIEKTIRAGDVLGIKGKHYVNTGLVLRSAEDSYDPNKPLTRDLAEQLKKELGSKRFKYPIMVPLRYLDLRLDNSNQYGLAFVLREDAVITHTQKVLNQPGKFESADIEPLTGLPKKTSKEGSRILYTREDGLSRLDVDYVLYLDSSWSSLGISGERGRVVVCGEAAGKKNLDSLLAQHITQLEAERNAQLSAVNQRHERALAVLKGKD